MWHGELSWKIVTFPKDVFAEIREHFHHLRGKFHTVHWTFVGGPAARLSMYYSGRKKKYREVLDLWDKYSWEVSSSNERSMGFPRLIREQTFTNEKTDLQKDARRDLDSWAKSTCTFLCCSLHADLISDVTCRNLNFFNILHGRE